MGVSGIVLAGGLSRRLGRDKAIEPIGGEPLIARCIGRLSAVADEIIVVVNGIERGKQLPLPPTCGIAVDVYADSGSLGAYSAAYRRWGTNGAWLWRAICPS